MAFLDVYKQRLNRLKSDLDTIFKDVLMRNKNDIVAYFQEEQIGQGYKVGTRKDLIKIKRKGSTYTGYSKYTQDIWKQSIDYKEHMVKTAGNHYYMEWTGDFFGQMDAYAKARFEIGIRSFDDKTPELLATYGSDLLEVAAPTVRIIEEDFFNEESAIALMKRINALV